MMDRQTAIKILKELREDDAAAYFLDDYEQMAIDLAIDYLEGTYHVP